ncbi:MAG: hypothetical protein AAFV95_22765 [Bacteroidota bacterium]
MKYLCSLCLFFCLFLTGAHGQDEPLPPLSQLAPLLLGEFDNFQQYWQQNTDDDKYRVEAEQKCLHVHARISEAEWRMPGGKVFFVEYAEGGGTERILSREAWHCWEDAGGMNIYTQLYVLPNEGTLPQSMEELGPIVDRWFWTHEEEGIIAYNSDNQAICRLENNVLSVRPIADALALAGDQPYLLRKCRFFSGWIQYPLPNFPDSTFLLRDLRMHDQGGRVQLQLADSSMVDYTLELSQLLDAEQTSILKLSLYDKPIDQVTINSKPISDSWTSPDAKRIGINLPIIASGWRTEKW